jgi:hypothetical protein
MNRRHFLAAGAGTLTVLAQKQPGVRLGIDLFSIRDSGWTPFEYLDYCARQGAKVVHFSEIRFVGSLETDHLQKVRAHADKLGIQCEIGMRSICPTSTMFDAKQGTAEERRGPSTRPLYARCWAAWTIASRRGSMGILRTA